MTNYLSNIFVSSNILLKYNKLLYISILNLYGVGKYKSNIAISLTNVSVYKTYTKINNKHYVYLSSLFNYITFNINTFKKRSDLYTKIKFTKLK
uniref:Uncharacterized protein n=2 Tax=Babesia TaxID=5864 RepID=A0A411ADB8_9APIC|nr:hypothetical protein BLAP_11 [Babesia sp. Lintan]QAX27034.1 hypothetical protein [Babesia motasi]QAX27065.1 hypothetical protein [Babesia motasi]